MLRWIGNIFFAVIIGTLGTYLIWALAVGEIPAAAPAVVLLLVAILALGAWGLGVTRLIGYRDREQSSLVLAYLEQAVRLNLPLPQMLLAAEASERGTLAIKIHQLLARLETGEGIANAVSKAVPGTSVRTLGLLGAAERIGQVGAELNRLVREQQKPPERSVAERSLIRCYPLFMAMAVTCILGMLMVFVVPKFQQILRDFRTPVPPITQAVINAVYLLGSNTWLQLAIELTAAAAIIQSMRLRVGLRKPAIRFTTSRHYADVCHVIAESLEAGLPLDSAMRSAGELAISVSLRQRLRRWADGIEQGAPVAQAAGDAGIPGLIAGLTNTSDTASAAEAFTFLSRYYAAKFSRLMTALHAAVVPAMVLFFGVIVATIALAMFMPLITMIDGLSHVGGSL